MINVVNPHSPRFYFIEPFQARIYIDTPILGGGWADGKLLDIGISGGLV